MGLNLYLYVSNSPAIGRDPSGEDMIVVGSRELHGFMYLVPAANHMSLEYWSGCALNSIPTHGVFDDRSRLERATGYKKTEQIELLRDTRYGRYYTISSGYDGIGDTLGWETVPVSRIYDNSEATKFHVIDWSMGKDALKSKWEEYKERGHSYPYALYKEDAIPAGKWPNVKYEALGNNCNTFIRWLIGAGYEFPGVIHPGNKSPVTPTDSGPIPTKRD